MLVGLADCCYRGGAASWPQKLSSGLKSKNSLGFLFFFVRIPKSKSKSRKLTFVESYQLIDHAKQMEVVDRAHHWNHSSWNPWFRDSLQMIQTLVPTAVHFSVWCFRKGFRCWGYQNVVLPAQYSFLLHLCITKGIWEGPSGTGWVRGRWIWRTVIVWFWRFRCFFLQLCLMIPHFAGTNSSPALVQW